MKGERAPEQGCTISSARAFGLQPEFTPSNRLIELADAFSAAIRLAARSNRCRRPPAARYRRRGLRSLRAPPRFPRP